MLCQVLKEAKREFDVGEMRMEDSAGKKKAPSMKEIEKTLDMVKDAMKDVMDIIKHSKSERKNPS